VVVVVVVIVVGVVGVVVVVVVIADMAAILAIVFMLCSLSLLKRVSCKHHHRRNSATMSVSGTVSSWDLVSNGQSGADAWWEQNVTGFSHSK
jgi:hypothetical protein